MRRLTPVLVAGAFAAVLSACQSDDPPPATGVAAGLDTQTITVGEVELTVTPARIDEAGATFTIAFDTHSVDLDFDVAETSTFVVDGLAWTDPAWDGAGPGGHHREGTLTFTAAGPVDGEAVLTIDGLDEPATARWALPEGA